MSIQAKQELLVQVAPRYREANSRQKSVVLDEFVAATGGVVRQNALVPSWAKVTLSQLLLWSLTGVFTPEERQALATGW